MKNDMAVYCTKCGSELTYMYVPSEVFDEKTGFKVYWLLKKCQKFKRRPNDDVFHDIYYDIDLDNNCERVGYINIAGKWENVGNKSGLCHLWEPTLI